LNIKVKWLVNWWFASPFLKGAAYFTRLLYFKLCLFCVLIDQSGNLGVKILHGLYFFTVDIAWLPAWFFGLFKMLSGCPQNSLELFFPFLTIRMIPRYRRLFLFLLKLVAVATARTEGLVRLDFGILSLQWVLFF